MNKPKYIKAKITSVWDDDIYIPTTCKINQKTKEIFDVKQIKDDNVMELKNVFVTINKKDYPAYRTESISKNEMNHYYHY